MDICRDGIWVWDDAWESECLCVGGGGHGVAFLFFCSWKNWAPLPGSSGALWGCWGVQGRAWQGPDSSLLPQGSPWTAPAWEVARRSQRPRK